MTALIPDGTRTAVPVPEGDDFMARDALWYAFAHGADWPELSPGTRAFVPTGDTTVAPPLPVNPDGRAGTPLPPGTVELLERLGPADRWIGPLADRLGHALSAAFGVQRREPENPFNDHRGYPSVRSKFPVHVLVRAGGRTRVLDVYRQMLIETAAVPCTHNGPPEVMLAARYTRLPAVYRWFRGSLVNIELGISLRMLYLGLELFDLSGRLALPDRGGHRVLAEAGLGATWQWALPLRVGLGAAPILEPAPPSPEMSAPEAPPPDPILAEVVAMNRTQDDPGVATADATIPARSGPAGRSWAELLWRRSSGRMPRGLYGMNGTRRQQPARVLSDAVAWISAATPSESLREVWQAVTTTAVVQGVDGHTDGIYRLVDGALRLHRADPVAAARLETHYGYPLAPGNGCDVRHAAVIWFFSTRPREVAERFGSGGWTLAQYVCGWAAQGACLAAAGHDLYARPVRAFQELPAREVLDLAATEMLQIAVITGTPRYVGPLLDVRL